MAKKRKTSRITASQSEAVAKAAVGAVVGGIIAGPVGAVIGGATGALVEKGPTKPARSGEQTASARPQPKGGGNAGSVARALVTPGKGILAADESLPTIAKRFQTIRVESTEESRRSYRALLCAAPGLGEFISGVILFDETIRQKADDGTPLVEVLKGQGIIPGIKVDRGAKALAGFAGEKVTEGLDGLRERFREYREFGAQFTKWRAVIAIGNDIPTMACLRANAYGLARFAALSQEAGLVPVVEPEVLMDGAHTIERCEEVTATALEVVFGALFEHRVRLEEMVLKPNMVVSGKECARKTGPGEVAEATLRCFRRVVPAALPGVVFLSGGQTEVEATRNLNALNQHKGMPWELSFSFGRALQAAALKAWAGRAKNAAAAQRALLHRARCNHQARLGRYTEDMEAA